MENKKIPEIQINNPGEGFKASLKSRVIVALILLVVAIPCVIFGSWFYFIFVSILACVGIHEIISATTKKYGWWVYVATYVITIAYIYWFLIRENVILSSDGISNFFVSDKFKTIDISALTVALSLICYFFIAVVDKNFGWDDVGHFFGMTMLFGIGIQSVFYLRFSPFYYFKDFGGVDTSTNTFKYLTSNLYVLFVLAGALLNDTYAYFGGVFFGKHKLNERISPKKTWEGFIIGWALTAITLTVLGLILAAVGYPVLPFLNLQNWFWIVILSAMIPLVGDLGDLSFSLIKRHYGIKDYGKILKGHGGILDRFDSVIFCAIAVATIVAGVYAFGLYIH